MHHARTRRRILAPIVALMLLVVGFRTAYAIYRCTGDGVTRSACCCPHDETPKEEAEQQTSIEAPYCCDVELADATSVDARIGSEGTSHEIASAPVFYQDWVVPTVRSSRRMAAPLYVPPSSGPPLRLVKQSFLI